MKKQMNVLVVVLLCVFLGCNSKPINTQIDQIKPIPMAAIEPNIVPVTTSPSPAAVGEEYVEVVRPDEPTRPLTPAKPRPNMEDVKLLALLMLCEAQGESEYGKRLVIDTVLNRTESGRFPTTIYEVIYQRDSSGPQYTPMYSNRRNQVVVTEADCNLVISEMENRTNFEVLYFRTKHFHNFGRALFQEGAHFFSTHN